ncbi:MAG: hypothetical protein IT337_07785 [Thermomicrobiales bacterium]|nr:hypothetical protein [Thermomicrobiales bacterium]
MPRPFARRRILRVGGDVAARRGRWRDRCALDLGPMAAPPGEPWRPPGLRWPVAAAAYDLVVLDDLALVVDEEAALAEAARALRPGGQLLLRVPARGPLAWLDAVNVSRYLRDATGRGARLPEARGLGWRRHYHPADLRDLLRAAGFRPAAVRRRGIGLAEAARLVALLRGGWREGGPGWDRHAAVLAGARRLDRRLPAPGFGWWWVVAATRVERTGERGNDRERIDDVR